MTARQIELKQRAKALTAERCQYEPDCELTGRCLGDDVGSGPR